MLQSIAKVTFSLIKRLGLAMLIGIFVLESILPLSARADEYPQFDVRGYSKYEFYNLSVSPGNNIFLAQTHLGSLPTNLGVSGPWQNRLKLQIFGQLSEAIDLAYDIEQQPETPQRSDVILGYNNNRVTFGDFTANTSGNEFATSSKFLNGLMVTSKTSDFEMIFVPSAKLRSNTVPVQTQAGNNTRGPYNLGRGAIVEGSESIEVNQVPQLEGRDYTIDYFEGKVTFRRILLPTDQIRYSFEFSNITDLFLPSASRRDFFAIQTRGRVTPDLFKNTPPLIPVPVAKAFQHIYPASVAGTQEAALFNYKKTYEATLEAGDRVPLPDILRVPSLPLGTYYESRGSAPGQSVFAIPQSFPIFKMEKKPVVPFSEALFTVDRPLKRGEDYNISYDDGLVIFNLGFTPSPENPFFIHYKAYETTEASVSLAGQDNRGPYRLLHTQIVKGSEKVLVDGKLRTPGLEYEIDRERGEVVFPVGVSSLSTISVTYAYIQKAIPVPAGVAQKPSGMALVVGATHLRESSRPGATGSTQTAIDVKTGADIRTDNILALDNFPLDDTATITVTVNGVTQTQGTDYTIPTSESTTLQLPAITDTQDASNGFATGAIRFLRNLAANDQIQVNYTYNRAVFGTYNGVGSGSRGPYFLTTANSMVPGSERIQAFDSGSTIVQGLSRNSSKTLNDGDYKINYNYPFTPYITFNNPFPAGRNFRVTFATVPTSRGDDQRVAHDITAVDAELTIGDLGRIRTDFALSRTDRVVSSQSTSDTLTGTNSRGPYTLSNQNLIEGSERIFVDGRLVNRDVDYFINYTAGQITFFFLTLSPANTLRAEYEFVTAGGGGVAALSNQGGAAKVEADLKWGGLKLSSKMRNLDASFLPIGSTQLGAGSIRYDNILAWDIAPGIVADTQLINTTSQIGTFRGFNVTSRDHTSALRLSTPSFGDFNVQYRTLRTFDDILPGATAHTQDLAQDSQRLAWKAPDIRTGLTTLSFRSQFERAVSINNASANRTRIYSGGVNMDARLSDFATGAVGIQVSEPLTTSGGGITQHSHAQDITTQLQWNFLQTSFKQLTTRVSFVNHDEVDFLTQQPLFTRNSIYHVDFVPITQISTAFDHNRQETRAIRIGGVNPLTERTQARIGWTPIAQLNFDADTAVDKFTQENGSQGEGTAHAIGIRWTPISVVTASARFRTQGRSFITVSDLSTVSTTNDTRVQDYNVVFTPWPFLTSQAGVILEDYGNVSAASAINTQTRNISELTGVSIRFPSSIDLGISFERKRTRNKLNGAESPKEAWRTRASYPLMGGGQAAYEFEVERNSGEVLGGVLTPLNIVKYSNVLKLIFTLPQSNPVLSNIQIIGSFRGVSYADYLTPGNSFLGRLVTFEGALNF